MATYKGTFETIFNDDILDGEEVIRLERIVIPLIQRDYAQGRDTTEIRRVRERFISALYDAINGTPITLDFIYGDIDKNGVMTPLDGQQRLTTLFLLYWYVAKHEDIDGSKIDFLQRFSYDTRYSARDFCGKLLEFHPSFAERISNEIIDQAWFPLEWKNDPTISSMLTMIDCIDRKFADTSNVWESLHNGAITFFFLPIKDMGLSDELYIKMNSRGKPLTLFEHFKAELEQNLMELDEEMARRISRKIDVDWTDMLWSYRTDDTIDDDFVNYFHFICEVIFYKENGTPVGQNNDIFELVNRNFSTHNDNALEYAKMLEEYFDCWVRIEQVEGIENFFDGIFSRTHMKGHVIIDSRHNINVFKDCLKYYGEEQRFGLRRFILLYAVVQYLLHYDEVTTEQFSRRMRIINNLINNSENDISNSPTRQSGNRLPGVVREVDHIMLTGKLRETEDKGFNVFQVAEEKEKIVFLEEHPEQEDMLFRVEDHELLYGQIRVMGLENYKLFKRFSSLFNCDYDRIDRAMMSLGDYKQEEKRGKYQLASSDKDIAWRTLFHKSSANGFENTKRVLVELLSREEFFTNESLDLISKSFIESAEASDHYDWRYYYVKYHSFRPGKYGKYVWEDFESDPYAAIALDTRTRVSSNAYNPFLKELDIYRNTRLEDCGQKLVISDEKFVQYEDHDYVLYRFENLGDPETYELIESLSIKNQDGYDLEDRIIKCRMWLRKILRIVVEESEDDANEGLDPSLEENPQDGESPNPHDLEPLDISSLVGRHIAKKTGEMAGVIVEANDEYVVIDVYSGPKAGQKVSISAVFLDPSKGVYVID